VGRLVFGVAKGRWKARVRTYRTLCLLFFLCFFILFSGGRLASGDAGAQLQAAMLLANTGKLGASTPYPKNEELWVQNRHGNYYEAHDIGNVIVMLPAAAAASALSKAPAEEKIQSPPILARFGVAMTYACISAFGCFFMFMLFSLFHTLKTSFLLSFAFATTTFYWAYAKAAWDVMGACVAVSLLLYLSAKILQEDRVQNRTIFFVGCAFVLACSFRFSLVPFLGLGVLVLYCFTRQKIAFQHTFTFVTTVCVGITPTLIYNFVRMGSPLRPASTAPQFHLITGLGGNVLQGLWGLLLSPNRGIFVFAPIFLLLFAIPFAFRSFPLPARRLLVSFGVVVVAYVLFIANLNNWGPLGWGPRYLLPIVPILFFAVGMILVELWGKHKYTLIGLGLVSVAVNMAPALVNWALATVEFPRAADRYALLPRQHMAVWNGMYLALQGKPLPAPPEIMNDPIRSGGTRFPDLWTFRLMERSTFGYLVGLVTLSALLAISLTLFVKLVSTRNDRSEQRHGTPPN
jgi:hypothetical protein